jgi:sec-independent protein translocase protein TatB
VFNLQGSEIIVILLLALVVLGPDKLPEAIRKFSRTYADFKKMSSGFQSELKSALDEPMREMRETAEMVRDAADPRKVADEAEAEARLRRDAERIHPEPIESETHDAELNESEPNDVEAIAASGGAPMQVDAAVEIPPTSDAAETTDTHATGPSAAPPRRTADTPPDADDADDSDDRAS